ncbi:LPS O-antigen chain length determinant protein WzzB [Pseudomonas sp. BJa3]|uniref:LPS O-antigen chain length determinant protein WzzB n=1 Tax=Pseudomonas sp. BJa3 TaxID=2986525 RepID=UPI002265D9B2|nr:Wzz/FepE/Etk N-terminal domain-containing protein [Pseudomonas sp. BJa3]MCX5509223.1 Wzz/FepE/Etk N-terminal domain-containing protein [Pseudomonas sp. BJa3]
MRNEREHRSGGESDLFDLLEWLWLRKVTIFLAALAGGVLAAIYAWMVAPVYESKVIVQPPVQTDIARLNYGRGNGSGLSLFSVKDVYGVYVRNLQSESLSRDFFLKYYLPSLSSRERAGSQDGLYRLFKEAVTLKGDGKEASGRFTVVVRSSDARRSVDWAQAFVEMAAARTKLEVIEDARSDALVLAESLEQQVEMARESTARQRKDRIAQLKEALKVARAVNIVSPPIVSNSLYGGLSADEGGARLYMRGSRALEAEIDNLANRVSDDSFIDGLRSREGQIHFLRKLNVASEGLQVFRQDGGVELPDAPIKPKKLLIVVLGVMLGAVLGVVLALLSYLRGNLHRFRCKSE